MVGRLRRSWLAPDCHRGAGARARPLHERAIHRAARCSRLLGFSGHQSPGRNAERVGRSACSSAAPQNRGRSPVVRCGRGARHGFHFARWHPGRARNATFMKRAQAPCSAVPRRKCAIPVARSPLPRQRAVRHGKTVAAAKRRQANVELKKLARDPHAERLTRARCCRADLESGRHARRSTWRRSAARAPRAQRRAALQLADVDAVRKAKGARGGGGCSAYGSLLWNPLFPFVESRPVMPARMHRRFLSLFDGPRAGPRDAPGPRARPRPWRRLHRGWAYRLPAAGSRSTSCISYGGARW